jgi:3-oxo-5-alpha-steroid 4-dehydrogenase 3 / polyprenol reductase
MAECAIYLSLTFIAAPTGYVVNKTILTALGFTVINLGVSAQISKEWYEKKFGKESVENKWRMVPLVY